MKLSVVILNYKVPYHLMLCLDSVERAIKNLDAEIIVVDNNSQDESVAWVKRYFPSVICIENSDNSGFSKGNNLGIKQAKGSFICLLNPDTVVGENCFVNALAYAEKKVDLGALGVRLIGGTGDFLPESKRQVPTPRVALEKMLGYDKNYYHSLHFAKNGKVPVLVGAFMLMRKDRYWEVGGLDEDYFMYGEDIDLSYKFLKKGYQNYYLGSERVIHFKGESTVKNKKYRERFFGAMHLFYQKHFNKKGLGLIKLGLKLIEGLYVLKTQKRNKPQNLKQVICIETEPEHNRAISKQVDLPLHLADKKLILKKDFFASLIIVEAKAMAYEEIIYLMQKQKAKQNGFRLIPSNFHFALGSDSSFTQGEIIKF